MGRRRRRNYITCTITDTKCVPENMPIEWLEVVGVFTQKYMATMGITECKGLTACLSEHPVS